MSPKWVLLGYTYKTSVFCLPPLLQVACRVLQGTGSITELFGREAISRSWQQRNSPHILKAHLGRPQNIMVIISGIVLQLLDGRVFSAWVLDLGFGGLIRRLGVPGRGSGFRIQVGVANRLCLPKP